MKKVYTQTQILRKIADLRVEVNYLKSTIAELSFPKTEAEARIKVVTDAVEIFIRLPLGNYLPKITGSQDRRGTNDGHGVDQ